MTIFGYILIVIGIFSVVFSLILYFDNFTLMEHLSAIDQYLMAGLLAIIFISIGFMIVKQESKDKLNKSSNNIKGKYVLKN